MYIVQNVFRTQFQPFVVCVYPTDMKAKNGNRMKNEFQLKVKVKVKKTSLLISLEWSWMSKPLSV